MTVTPIQVLEHSVLIPRQYLPNTDSFELVLTNDYVIIRPKESAAGEEASLSPLHNLIGAAKTTDPTASARVKEILSAEADSRSGWTHDSTS